MAEKADTVPGAGMRCAYPAESAPRLPIQVRFRGSGGVPAPPTAIAPRHSAAESCAYVSSAATASIETRVSLSSRTVEQRSACQAHNLEVEGSNPSGATSSRAPQEPSRLVRSSLSALTGCSETGHPDLRATASDIRRRISLAALIACSDIEYRESLRRRA